MSAFIAVVMLCASGRMTVLAQGAAPPQFSIELPLSHEHYRDRITRAAAESLAQLSLWLGPFPHRDLTIRGATSLVENNAAAATIHVRLPWLSAPSTMEVEREVAYAIAMQYWPHSTADAAVARGLAAYLQGRITERLFNVAYARAGYRTDRVRFFGGYVPWSIPSLRLNRWNPGDGREAAPFLALERYLSWPVLQGALKALAASTRAGPLTQDAALSVMSAAVGQDLGRFFDVAFDPGADVDYALTELTSARVSEPCPQAGCLRTRVTVARRGNAPFSSVPLRVVFTDEQEITIAWDSRTTKHTFELESPAPARVARLDPEGVLLVDATRLDHVRYVSPETNVPIAKWAARWLVWLQDALLTYTTLV